jgi:hypothetical protein
MPIFSSRHQSASCDIQLSRFTLLALIGLTLFTPSFAWSESPTWYQVEMVIFRHLGERALSEELHLESAAPIEAQHAFDLSQLTGDLTRPPETFLGSVGEVPSFDLSYFEQQETDESVSISRSSNPHYQPLPESENSLESVRRALSRRSEYRVIGLLGWRQAGLDERTTQPLHLQMGASHWASILDLDEASVGESNKAKSETSDEESSEESLASTPHFLAHELAGTIKVFRERYLHIHTDLLYRIPRSEWSEALADQLPAWQKDIAIPLQHQRRMRSSETHYLDHPVVGIIIRVKSLERAPLPLPPPSEEEEEG